MVHEDLYVEDILAEVLSIRTSGSERRRFVFTYEPPNNNTWKFEVQKECQSEVLKCLDNMLRTDRRVLLVEDLNIKNVN